MRYYGTEKMDSIAFMTDGEHPEMHFIMMMRTMHDPLLEVTCCCDSEWNYLFDISDASNYERLKYDIMECAAYSLNMKALTSELDRVFTEQYGGIMITFDEGESHYMN